MNKREWMTPCKLPWESRHLDIPIFVLVAAAFLNHLLGGQEPRLPDLLLEHGEVPVQPDVGVQGPPLARPALNILAALHSTSAVSARGIKSER